MLLERSLFVLTDDLGRSRKLRHRFTATFWSTYYGAAPVSVTLAPLLIREVARRWAVRDQDVQGGEERLPWAGNRLLSRSFAKVLNDVSDAGWADSCRAGDAATPLQ